MKKWIMRNILNYTIKIDENETIKEAFDNILDDTKNSISIVEAIYKKIYFSFSTTNKINVMIMFDIIITEQDLIEWYDNEKIEIAKAAEEENILEYIHIEYEYELETEWIEIPELI